MGNANTNNNNSLPPEKKEANGLNSNLQGNGTLSDELQTKQKSEPANITNLEVEQLKKEAAEYKDKYFRVLAEAENARKRLQKERQELVQFAVQNVIADFLNPIDNLENALGFAQQASDEVKHWALGFQMILNQFKDVLASNGAVPIKSVGAAFDPHYHEAIEMISTSDFPQGIVVSETVKGYRMGERTIRPARVKVAQAPQSEQEDNTPVEKN